MKQVNQIVKRRKTKDGTILEWREVAGLIEISTHNPNIAGVQFHLSFSQDQRLMARITWEELLKKHGVRSLRRR